MPKLALFIFWPFWGQGFAINKMKRLRMPTPTIIHLVKASLFHFFSTIFDTFHRLKRLKLIRDPTQSIMGKVECLNFASIFLTKYHWRKIMKNAHRVKDKPWIVHCCREQFIYKYWFLLKYERQSGFAFVSADEEAFKLIPNIQV